MQIYTDFLINKEKKDNELASFADDALRHDRPGMDSVDRIAHTRRAILEILDRFGIEASEVRNYHNTEELLSALLDPLDILYQRIDMEDDSWKRQSAYVLAFTEDGEPLVISPSFLGYKYYNPATLSRKTVTGKLRLQKDGYMIFRPLGSGSFSIRNFVNLMMHLISPRDLPCIIVASLMVSLLGLVAPNMNRSILTEALKLGDGAIPYIINGLLVFLLAGLAKAAFSTIKTLMLGRMKQRVSNQMQSAIMGGLLLMPYDYFTKGDTGRLSSQVRNGSRLSNMVLDFAMGNLLNVVFALVYIPQMEKLAPALVIPALLFLAARMLLSVMLTLASARHSARRFSIEQDSDSFVFDVLRGIQKIQGMGAQKRVYARIATKYRNVLAAEIKPPLYIRLSGTLQSLISGLSSAVILIIAALAEVSQPDYIAFTASYALISNTVSAMVSMVNNLVSMKPLKDQLTALFDYEGKETGVEYVRNLGGDIELRNLCFSYDKGVKGCIDHINLHIHSGEKIAIVGESGCGKSTLLKLLLGMLVPDQGAIFYDGKPLSTLNKRSLRKKIASVFQFTKVFPGTVLDNICFTSEQTSEEVAWDAAEKASIASVIRKLPLGMDTEISEGNGGGFSGGQKQRLMLARAFAQNPSILILDEATSALDNISQHEVLESVYALGCTVLMVAHRLSTVVNCDRIIMLKDGKIVEDGNYETLVNNNGAFAELVRRQQECAV